MGNDNITHLPANPRKPIARLRLNTLENLKKSLARLTNAMLAEGADVSALRGAVYACNALIATYKIDFEKRIENLEDIARENKNR